MKRILAYLTLLLASCATPALAQTVRFDSPLNSGLFLSQRSTLNFVSVGATVAQVTAKGDTLVRESPDSLQPLHTLPTARQTYWRGYIDGALHRAVRETQPPVPPRPWTWKRLGRAFASFFVATVEAQNIRQLPRATATTGVNDSALVLVSDSASRTRAQSIGELKRTLARGDSLDSVRVKGILRVRGRASMLDSLIALNGARFANIIVTSCTGCPAGGGGATVTDTVRAVTFDSVKATRFWAGDGTAAAPSISLLNSRGTGLYRFGVDTLGFSNAGVWTWRMLAGPKLEGNGSIAIAPIGASQTTTLYATGITGTPINVVVLSHSSNVGQLQLNPTGGESQPSVTWVNDNNTGFFNRNNADTIGVTTGGFKSLYIAGGANTLLQGGAGNMTIQAGTGNSRTMTLQTTTSAGAAKNTLVLGADSSATFLGQVNIGAGGANANSGLLYLNGGSSSGGGGWVRMSRDGTASGYVGVHGAFTGSTDNALSIYAESGKNLYLRAGGVIKVRTAAATGAGDVSLCWKTDSSVTQGATCGSSTAKIKTNITTLSPQVATRTLMALSPKHYRYKLGFYNERREFGLIAEEAAKVNRDLAFYAGQDDASLSISKGDPINVNDRAVLAVLIATVQQQQRQIDSLRARLPRVQSRTP